MRTNEILSEAVPAKKPLVPHIELETELQKQLTKQRKDLSQKEKQISFYKQSLSNNKQQLTKAQKRLDTLSADPAADQQKIKNLTDTIKYLTPYVNSDLKIINKLTKEVEKLKKSIPKLEQQVQQQQATQKSPIDPKMVNRLVKQIQTNCGWYLDLMKAQNKWLYRGRSKGRGIGEHLAFASASPTTRAAMDSSKAATKIYDQLSVMLGIKALRSNSIFVTATFNQAQSYGQVYYIFPYDSAVFSWSRTHDDVVVQSNIIDSFVDYGVREIDNMRDKITNKYHLMPEQQFAQLPKSEKKYFELVYNFELDYDEDTAISIKQFAARVSQIKPDSPLLPLLEKEPVYRLKDFQRVYQLASDRIGFAGADESFVAALQSGHEVLIHGKYIAVKQDLWPYIKDLL